VFLLPRQAKLEISSRSGVPLTEAFIGIDPAFAKRKRLPISISTWRDGRLVPMPLRRLAFLPPAGEGNVATLDDERVNAFAREAGVYVERVEGGGVTARLLTLGYDQELIVWL